MRLFCDVCSCNLFKVTCAFNPAEGNELGSLGHPSAVSSKCRTLDHLIQLT